MIELYLHKRPVQSVFSLLGEKENDITFSIGWAFSRSPTFLKKFLSKAITRQSKIDINELEISLQEYQKDSGVTDIEIKGEDIHVIIEAKRGLWLPTKRQFLKYHRRFNPKVKNVSFITMTECPEHYALQNLPRNVKGVPVKHFSWNEIASLSEFSDGSQAEKHLMKELRNYLATIVVMQKQDSNWVYVVSLNGNFVRGLSFIDVVKKRRRYFHRIGVNGWPKEPPNYLGFRYDGKLQSIHHVEKTEVIDNFHEHFPEAPDKKQKVQLFLYHLGKPIKPNKDVRTGKIWTNGRHKVMIDLLLTSKSVEEAFRKSKLRLENI